MSTAVINAHIEAVACAAPGLPDWHNARAVLRGDQPYVHGALPEYQPALLPPNERRRASGAVRMAFRVAEAATQASSVAASELATVFSSSDGDLTIAQRICAALATPQRFISPTDFHNSVHNAAAGYWSIASASRGAATAVAAFDHSFAVGLLEALTLVQVEHCASLLVCCELPAPAPLHAKRPVRDPMGVALVFTPQLTTNTLVSITAQLTQASESSCDDAALEALRIGNPAARALPLLQAVARGQSATVQLPSTRQRSLQIDVRMPANGSTS